MERYLSKKLLSQSLEADDQGNYTLAKIYVMKRGKTLNLPKDNPYSGCCSTRQPQEHRDVVVIEVASGTSPLPYPTREQVKTYRAPVQETLINSSQ
ncbi:uncharacterized protein LOC111322721 isoform X2 [Stylophora pistillata]|uniref:uncharacterized protein LOC111322721 isoform X2 n=1 Tax=Stylophora pistillata TaxID=50429 RepID=UPI000C04D55C|nr:uncharacterized protein LOC111322721 isoform X2 [Stylophora pistillata]